MGVNLSSVEALLFMPLTQCLHPKPYTLSTTALLDRRVCCSNENVLTLTLTLTLMQPFDFGRHKLVLWITKGLWNKHHIFVLIIFKAEYTSYAHVCSWLYVCVHVCICLVSTETRKGRQIPRARVTFICGSWKHLALLQGSKHLTTALSPAPWHPSHLLKICFLGCPLWLSVPVRHSSSFICTSSHYSS